MKNTVRNCIAFAVFINLSVISSVQGHIFWRWKKIGIGATKKHYDNPEDIVLEIWNKKSKPICIQVRNGDHWYPFDPLKSCVKLKRNDFWSSRGPDGSSNNIDLSQRTYICVYEEIAIPRTYKLEKTKRNADGALEKKVESHEKGETYRVLRDVYVFEPSKPIYVRFKEKKGREVFGPQTGARKGRAGSEKKGTAKLTDTGLSMKNMALADDFYKIEDVEGFKREIEALRERAQTVAPYPIPNKAWCKSMPSASQSMPNLKSIIKHLDLEDTIQTSFSCKKSSGKPEKPLKDAAEMLVFELLNEQDKCEYMRVSHKANNSKVRTWYETYTSDSGNEQKFLCDDVIQIPAHTAKTLFDNRIDVSRPFYIYLYDKIVDWRDNEKYTFRSVYQIAPNLSDKYSTVFIKLENQDAQEKLVPQQEGRKRKTKSGLLLADNVNQANIKKMTTMDSLRPSRIRNTNGSGEVNKRRDTEDALEKLKLEAIKEPTKEEIDYAYEKQAKQWNPAVNNHMQTKNAPLAREVMQELDNAHKKLLKRAKKNAEETI